MVKELYKCCICHKIGKINICRNCTQEFCDSCLDKIHPGIEYHNDFELGDSRINYVNYCAFKCISSKSPNFCFDCGENYLNMQKCLCCLMVFCSNCNKNNLLNKKIIPLEDLNISKKFCSKSCYEIFVESPNNRWCVCEDCGNEYYDISYKKMCNTCLKKYNYHKDVLFNQKRIILVNKIKSELENGTLTKKDLVEHLSIDVTKLNKQWTNIKENKVTFDMWILNRNAGNNMCYNIWDEAVDHFLNFDTIRSISYI